MVLMRTVLLLLEWQGLPIYRATAGLLFAATLAPVNFTDAP